MRGRGYCSINWIEQIMKIFILTTKTTHHIYFVKKIATYYDIHTTILETKPVIPLFDTFHSFENDREIYEREELLREKDPSFKKYSKTIEFNNINCKGCVEFISKHRPDIIIVFGTGIIKEAIIEKCSEGIINLHGGDPQFYRGLDSHLWAIYHKEFSYLKVCLHKVNKRIDDGEIIELRTIIIKKDLELFMLRSENTRLCIKATLSALKKYEEVDYFQSFDQKSKGRYYSFMPSVLKEICLKNFNQYLRSL